MAPPDSPSLYQIKTRVWLHELGQALGRSATLDDVAEDAVDRIAADGFDWVWLLGVWQTGDAGRHVSRSRPEWQHEYRELLPDFTVDDICGSPFAVSEYVVSRDVGGPAALERFRKRLGERGIHLMLDLVANHTALDHPWVRGHSDFYIGGSEEDLRREPHNYCTVATRSGPRVLAHGRDPYFPAWPDTLQVNYRHRGFRTEMLDVLDTIADQCDGLRCDMAMLMLPEVIVRTWGDRGRPGDGSPPVDEPFWPVAIHRVRQRHPGFVFLAEAYWDLEWSLQRQGFDYTYDKRLYDRVRAHDAGAVRGHLLADPDYQRRSARFLENHDEPRAAAVFPLAAHEAAAILTFLVPGLRFIHEGQLAGRRLRTSNHLCRRAPEPVDEEIGAFYERLLSCMRRKEVRAGGWRLLEARAAWEGNPTWDRFIAFSWERSGRRVLVTVNYGPSQAQCYVQLPWVEAARGAVVFQDLITPTIRYERDGAGVSQRGLYLDMSAWSYHVFDVIA